MRKTMLLHPSLCLLDGTKAVVLMPRSYLTVDCGLDVSISPEFMCWNPDHPYLFMWWSTEVGTFEKSLGHKGRGCTRGINALIKARRQLSIWALNQTPTHLASALVLDTTASRIVRNQCVLFNPPLYGILFQQSQQTVDTWHQWK